MAKILNAIHRFKAIPIKSPMTFNKIRTNNPKINGTIKNTELTSILRKKNKAGGISWANSKQYYRAAAIKTMRHGQRKQTSDQWNRTESSSEPRAHLQLCRSHDTYGRVISDKGGKNRQSLQPVALEKLDSHT